MYVHYGYTRGNREKLISFIIHDGGVRSSTTRPMRVYTWVVAPLIAYTTGLVQIKFPSNTAFYPRACCSSRLDKRIVTLRRALLATRYRREYRLSFCSSNSTSIELRFYQRASYYRAKFLRGRTGICIYFFIERCGEILYTWQGWLAIKYLTI